MFSMKKRTQNSINFLKKSFFVPSEFLFLMSAGGENESTVKISKMYLMH